MSKNLPPYHVTHKELETQNQNF